MCDGVCGVRVVFEVYLWIIGCAEHTVKWRV